MSPMKSKKYIKSYIKAKKHVKLIGNYSSVDADTLKAPKSESNFTELNSVNNISVDNSKTAIIPIYPMNSNEDILHLINGKNGFLKTYKVTCRIVYEDPDYGTCYNSETFPVFAYSPKEIPELVEKKVAVFNESWFKYIGKYPKLDSITDLYVRLRPESCENKSSE